MILSTHKRNLHFLPPGVLLQFSERGCIPPHGTEEHRDALQHEGRALHEATDPEEGFAVDYSAPV